MTENNVPLLADRAAEAPQNRTEGTLAAFGRALFFTLAAALITSVLDSYYDRIDFQLFYLAVLIATYYFGKRTGLLTIAGSSVAGGYLFYSPLSTFWTTHFRQNVQTTVVLALFILISGFLVWLIDRLKRTQAAQQAEHDRLENIVATAPCVIYSFRQRPDGSVYFPYLSPGSERIFGVPGSNLEQDGAPLFARIDVRDIGHVKESITLSRQNLTPWRDEFRIHHPTKGELWVLGHSMPQREPDGSTLWHGTASDITAQKIAAQGVEAQANFTQSTIDALTAHLCVLDESGKILATNKAWNDFADANPPRPTNGSVGDNYLDVCDAVTDAADAVEAAAFAQGIRSVIQGGRDSYSMEYPCHSSTEKRWFFGRVSRFLGSHGIRVVVVHEDISERKRTEQALLESAIRYQTMFDRATDGILILALDGTLIDVNESFARMHGYDVNELRALNMKDLDIAATFKLMPERNDRMMAGEALTFEVEHIHKEGHTFPLEVSASVVTLGGKTYIQAFHRDITERKRAEETLRANEARFRKLLDKLPLPLSHNDKDGIITFRNERFVQVFGYTVQDTANRDEWFLRAYPDPTYRQWVMDTWHAAVQRAESEGRDIEPIEYNVTCKNGDLKIVEISGITLGDEVLVTFIDHTERRKAEKALSASEARLSFALEASNIGAWELDILDRSARCTSIQSRIFGYDSVDTPWSYEIFLGHVLPEDRADVDRRINEAIRAETNVNFECRIRRTDGEVRWIWASGGYERESHGKAVRLSGIVQDITERKQAANALQESESRLRFVTDNAHVGLVMVNAERRYTFANSTYAEILGLPSPNIIGMRVADVLSTIYDDQIRPRLDRAFTGEPVAFELFLPTAGAVRYFAVRYEPTTVENKVSLVVVVITDITERKCAEEALRASEERFRQLAENINEVFWSVDPVNGRMIYISPAYEKIWGRTCASLYQSPQSWMDAIHPDDRDQVRQAYLSNVNGGKFDETYRIQKPDGAIRWIRDRGYPIFNDRGDVYRVVGTASDMTEQRNLEEQLRQSQKMEAFGLLAGGVAHDFNNLMNVVIGYSDIWLLKLPPDAPIRTPLHAIKNAGLRAADLTKQLLAFSRKTVLEPKIVDLNSIVRDTEKMLHRLIGEDVQLSSLLDPSIPRIKIDPGQIGQVLINLAVNARDAMPQGGTLTIQTGRAEFDDAYVQANPGSHLGRQVMLAVSDTGCGMAPEIIAHIFEPFFTTKGVGKGTGLGLAVVHGIFTQSGGSIQVDSKVGAGSTFRLYFPITLEAIPQANKSGEILTHAGFETILLVEDENSLREMVELTLQTFGYKVLAASSGKQALEIISRIGTTIDLMLTDVVMPGMSGRELTESVKAKSPGLKIVYMSGYTDDSVVRHGIDHENVAFLQKPFSPFDLLKKMRDVLDTPS